MTVMRCWIFSAVVLCAVAVVLTGCPQDTSASSKSRAYSAPYLLDFSFSFFDLAGHAVTVEPSELTVNVKESGNTISPSETAFVLAKGANKELKCFLVLDYTKSMYDSNAIESMEADAKDFINKLNIDAQIGLYEFHRAEGEASEGLVTDFSSDKDFLASRIDAIQSEYVANYPASTRCWDTVYEALSHFEAKNTPDERRFVLFLSDGRDESSIKKPADIIKLADSLSVRIFPIGFGKEVNPGDLKNIARDTGGEYYSATNVEQLQAQFQQIVSDLGGQYSLRWATLRRTGTFRPSFTVKKGVLSRTFSGPEYAIEKYAGDTLHGILRVPEYAVQGGQVRIFLRAFYVPRYVTQLRFKVRSALVPRPQLVSKADGGLCPDWSLTTTPMMESPGDYWIKLRSGAPEDKNSAMVFGGFGPLVYFDFADIPSNAAQTFFQVKEFDNSVLPRDTTFGVEDVAPST